MAGLLTIRTIDLQDVRIREVLAAGGAVIPAHHHAHAHLTLIDSGMITDSAGGSIEVLHPGDVLFRPAGAVHENLIAEAGSRGVIIDISGALLASVSSVWPGAAESIRTDTQTLRGVPARILEELRQDDHASPFLLRGLIFELLGIGARVLRPSVVSAGPPPWLADAVAIIAQRYAEPLTIADVAREAGASATRLRDALRRWHGSTFADMLREQRIEVAAALLETDRSLQEIAATCGFYDQSHFTRAFHDVRGITPHRHRARLRCLPFPARGAAM